MSNQSFDAAAILTTGTVRPRTIASKPLGGKAYGHIPHLPGSKIGPGDHKCHEGQARIATEKPRDSYDVIVCQEKLDGSCVSIAKKDGVIHPLTRAGYRAETSPFDQHRFFASWVMYEHELFDELLNDGERLCGEWLLQAHGTRYALPHIPFVAFDLIDQYGLRMTYKLFQRRFSGQLPLPRLISIGPSLPVEIAMSFASDSQHGALDEVEGVVYRVERHCSSPAIVDFLCKYVRPDKADGCYLPEITGGPPVWNNFPKSRAFAWRSLLEDRPIDQ
jgi:hypothetical protein